jgi:hypothetical protein
MSPLTKALEIVDSVREASGNGTMIADKAASKYDAVANALTLVREAIELQIFEENSRERIGWGETPGQLSLAPEPVTPMQVVDLSPDIYVSNKDGDRLMKWEGEIPPIGQGVQVYPDQTDWRIIDVSRREFGKLILIIVEPPDSVYYAGLDTSYNRKRGKKSRRSR